MSAPTASASLGQIVTRISPCRVTGQVDGVEITSVTYDDRMATPGSLHCCIPGERADGHDFAARARSAGAVAFVCERPLGGDAGGAPQLFVRPGEVRHAMALAACTLFGDPASSFRCVGVTGTNGKTTTTFFLGAIFEANGWKPARVGTLGGVRTTPAAPELQGLFASFRRAGKAAVVVEVSSHALAQGRVDGYRHDVAVFTNLSQDHLDYHENLEAYFQAKALLFTPEHSARAVVNGDDPYGRRLLDSPSIETEVFGLADASDLQVNLESSRFTWESEPVRLRVGGELNVRNAIAAAAAARALGVPRATIAEGLSEAVAPSGRLELVPNDLGASIFVDYAHTPDALTKVLEEARLFARGVGGHLIVVFGSGGDRDVSKRPLMGAAASRLADVAIITADNPRHEDPSVIVDQVRAGCDGRAELHVEVDRRRAIELAVSVVATGDVLVVAGKGHETTQQLGDELVPFDDREVLADALAARQKAKAR